MQFTLKSKKFGHDIDFSRPGASYLYVDLTGGNQPGTLGNQMCHGGELTGPTMTYGGDSIETFEKICRQWWGNYLKNEREI